MSSFLRSSSLCRSLLGIALALFAIHPATAADTIAWPERSGPTFDGHATAADAKGVPTQWNETSGQNIAWKIPLEGEGLSTPVIGYGKVWLTAATKDGKEQYLYCIDAASGKVLHHKLIFKNEKPEPLGNNVNTYASPSCFLEPGALYVHFGSYGTVRVNPETLDVVWERRDLPCSHFRGPGSSPFVFENLLVLTFDGIDQQYLTALDKHSGKTVWRTDRSTNYNDLNAEGKPRANGDLRKAYCTPGLVKVDGQWQLISVGSRAGFAYEPLTGKEIWTIEHPTFNASCRPLFLPGLALLNVGEGSRFYGVRLDSTTRGNITKSHVTWERKKGNSKHSSPVVVDGRIYMVTDNGIVYAVDTKTGEDVWQERIGGAFVASPIVAEKTIYVSDEKGFTTVFKAGDKYAELARNELAEGTRSSPAIAGGALYLRTFGHLYKIAAPAAGK